MNVATRLLRPARRSVICSRLADVRTPEELLAEFQEYPDRFWDNRDSKLNPRQPDYKHKDSGDGIWMQSPDAEPASPPPSFGAAAPRAGQPMHQAEHMQQRSQRVAGGDYGSDYEAASSVATGGIDQAPASAARACLSLWLLCPVLYNPGRILLSDIRKIVLTNL